MNARAPRESPFFLFPLSVWLWFSCTITQALHALLPFEPPADGTSRLVRRCMDVDVALLLLLLLIMLLVMFERITN